MELAKWAAIVIYSGEGKFLRRIPLPAQGRGLIIRPVSIYSSQPSPTAQPTACALNIQFNAQDCDVSEAEGVVSTTRAKTSMGQTEVYTVRKGHSGIKCGA